MTPSNRVTQLSHKDVMDPTDKCQIHVNWLWLTSRVKFWQTADNLAKFKFLRLYKILWLSHKVSFIAMQLKIKKKKNDFFFRRKISSLRQKTLFVLNSVKSQIFLLSKEKNSQCRNFLFKWIFSFQKYKGSQNKQFLKVCVWMALISELFMGIFSFSTVTWQVLTIPLKF